MLRKKAVMRMRVSLFVLPLIVMLTACNHFTSSRESDREKAKLYLQIATDQLQERNYNKALEAVHEALEFDAQFPAAYNHLALIYMETKRYPKSEEAFRKALDLQADYPEVYNNLGVLKNREEKFEEAAKYFEKALSYDRYSTPENAYTNLGYAHYRMGNLSKAKFFHQKALDVMPQFCLASKNLGDVYVKEKNYSKAAEYFDRAITHCPLYQESQYKLGLVQMKMGNKTVARNYLEKLIEKHKSGPFVDRSNEVLKYLQ